VEVIWDWTRCSADVVCALQPFGASTRLVVTRSIRVPIKLAGNFFARDDEMFLRSCSLQDRIYRFPLFRVCEFSSSWFTKKVRCKPFSWTDHNVVFASFALMGLDTANPRILRAKNAADLGRK
jgi:hypothetical protein